MDQGHGHGLSPSGSMVVKFQPYLSLSYTCLLAILLFVYGRAFKGFQTTILTAPLCPSHTTDFFVCGSLNI